MGATRALKFGKYALAALVCTVAVSAAVSTAEASHIRRNDCFGGYGSEGARGRQMGVRNAGRLFNNIWNRMGRNCAQLDRLATVIADTPLAPPMSRGAFQACFYQGYVETLFQGLDDASNRCADKCFDAGSEIGKISAQGYCLASQAVGGLDDPGFIQQPALPLCGFNIVMGCKSEYIQTAIYDMPACRQFTEGYYSDIFDNTVRQDCFVPSDVPIRDVRGHGYAAADSYLY